MPTINQLVRKGRKPQRRKPKSPALQSRPQLSGIVTMVMIRKPKKPNSSEKKCVRVRLSNGKEVNVYVGGEGHNLQEHSRVLVRGGHVRDLPNVHYHIVRGNRDCNAPHSVEPCAGRAYDGHRRQARSKYGQKRPDK